MRAVVFQKSIPRYAVMKLAGPKRAARWATGSLRSMHTAKLVDIPEQPLPGKEWIRVKPILTGVCGSDLSVICSKGSPYFSPLTSSPFVFGHEVVGTITDIGADVAGFEGRQDLSAMSVGDRVVLEPALGCVVRGIDPPCEPCVRGQNGLCNNITRGCISAGIQTGYCRDTGGAWSDSFVAHRSQLHAVPDGVSDEAAVLAEPLACVVHGVLRALPADDQTVLVTGCGSIGLLTIAAIRAFGCKSKIIAIAKYEHQRQHAARLGADVLLPPVGRNAKQGYAAWAEQLNAELHFPEIGKPTVVGGADIAFDCIGSSASIDDTVRFTTGGGSMVLVGMPGIPHNVDWTAIWFKELTLMAAYAYGLETIDETPFSPACTAHTCELALRILQKHGNDLAPLLSKPYALEDYMSGVRAALFTGSSGNVKTIFRI